MKRIGPLQSERLQWSSVFSEFQNAYKEQEKSEKWNESEVNGQFICCDFRYAYKFKRMLNSPYEKNSGEREREREGNKPRDEIEITMYSTPIWYWLNSKKNTMSRALTHIMLDYVFN